MFDIDGCKLPSNASKSWSGTKEERQTYHGTNSQRYTAKDFHYNEKIHTCICSTGKKLCSNDRHHNLKGYEALKFQGAKRDCVPCSQQKQCFQKPDITQTRLVAIIIGPSRSAHEKQDYRNIMQ